MTVQKVHLEVNKVWKRKTYTLRRLNFYPRAGYSREPHNQCTTIQKNEKTVEFDSHPTKSVLIYRHCNYTANIKDTVTNKTTFNIRETTIKQRRHQPQTFLGRGGERVSEQQNTIPCNINSTNTLFWRSCAGQGVAWNPTMNWGVHKQHQYQRFEYLHQGKEQQKEERSWYGYGTVHRCLEKKWAETLNDQILCSRIISWDVVIADHWTLKSKSHYNSTARRQILEENNYQLRERKKRRGKQLSKRLLPTPRWQNIMQPRKAKR